MVTKICYKCKLEKNVDEFSNFKHTKDGKTSYCKICKSEIDKISYYKNRDKNKEKRKKYRQDNKKMLNDGVKKWVNENYEYYIEKKREYSASERGLSKKRERYHKNKIKNNHIIAWRTLLNNTLKRLGTKKESSTIELLGYSALELKNHIEKQFTDGMSWINYGKWHIDHKKPVSLFDKSEKVAIVNALSNLQPLWALDNLKKYKNICV